MILMFMERWEVAAWCEYCGFVHSLICGFSVEGTSTSGSAVLTARNIVGGVYFNPQCLASSAATGAERVALAACHCCDMTDSAPSRHPFIKHVLTLSVRHTISRTFGVIRRVAHTNLLVIMMVSVLLGCSVLASSSLE